MENETKYARVETFKFTEEPNSNVVHMELLDRSYMNRKLVEQYINEKSKFSPINQFELYSTTSIKIRVNVGDATKEEFDAHFFDKLLHKTM